MYKIGERIVYIPDATTGVRIKLYKEDLGASYSSIVVYLLKYEPEAEEDTEAHLPSVLAAR